MTKPAATFILLSTLLAMLSAAPTVLLSQDPADALARADTAFRASRFVDAADAYQSVLELNPANGEAHTGLVRSLLKQRRVDAAAEAAAKALIAVPGHARLHAAAGDVLFRQGDFAGAQARYVEALALDSRCARGHLGLASLYLIERHNVQAKNRILQAYQLDPRDPEVFRAWARTLDKSADVGAALQQYLAMGTGEDLATLLSVRADIAARKALGDRRTSVIADPGRAYRLPLHAALELNGPVQGYWLQVLMNGQKLRLKLDTGSSGILLNRKAGEIGRVTRLADKAPELGVGRHYAGLAEKVQIGNLAIADLPVDVAATQVLEGIDGLIGADVFEHFLVRLRFPDGVMELEPPEAGRKSIAEDYWGVERIERPGFTPVHLIKNHLAVDTRINDIPGFLMLLDSGAYSHVLSMRAAKRAGRTVRSEGRQVNWISGAVETQVTLGEVKLQFAGVVQPGKLLAVDFDTTNWSMGTEISGLIGLDALRLLDMTIDYTNALVRFEYRQR